MSGGKKNGVDNWVVNQKLSVIATNVILIFHNIYILILRYVYLEKNGGKKNNTMYNTMREEF